jgi:allantoate deiminase
MKDAGLEVREDAMGNIIGRLTADDHARRSTIAIGSHFDTVTDAGRFDGVLGVLAALEAVELMAAGTRPDLPLEVIAFADEEGARFGAGCLGSRAMTRGIDAHELAGVDDDGVSLADAIRVYTGRTVPLRTAVRAPGELCAYIELHIEQGPVLDHEGVPVGVVDAILGQTRYEVAFEGEPGHAGTVPMALRRDALCAAAELILRVEQTAAETEGLVATVGHVAIEPNSANVIAGKTRSIVDLRHSNDHVRRAAVDAVLRHARGIATSRGLRCQTSVVSEQVTVGCAGPLCATLTDAVTALGLQPLTLSSGAGHDAAAMAAIAPVGMLFVRCVGGVSHSPAERVGERDIDTAVQALMIALARITVPTDISATRCATTGVRCLTT